MCSGTLSRSRTGRKLPKKYRIVILLSLDCVKISLSLQKLITLRVFFFSYFHYSRIPSSKISSKNKMIYPGCLLVLAILISNVASIRNFRLDGIKQLPDEIDDFVPYRGERHGTFDWTLFQVNTRPFKKPTETRLRSIVRRIW